MPRILLPPPTSNGLTIADTVGPTPIRATFLVTALIVTVIAARAGSSIVRALVAALAALVALVTAVSKVLLMALLVLLIAAIVLSAGTEVECPPHSGPLDRLEQTQVE